MAEVKMSLAELKALEAKIESLEKKNAELVDLQRSITVNHKYFQGRLVGVDRGRTGISNVSFVTQKMRPDRWDYSYEKNIMDFSEAYNKGLVRIEFTAQECEQKDVELINLDDVKALADKDAEKRFETKLAAANSRGDSLMNQLAIADTKHSKRMAELRSDHEADIDKLNAAHAEDIKVLNEKADILQKEINRLIGIKEDKTLRDHYAEALSELSVLKSRNLLQRIINN